MAIRMHLTDPPRTGSKIIQGLICHVPKSTIVFALRPCLHTLLPAMADHRLVLEAGLLLGDAGLLEGVFSSRTPFPRPAILSLDCMVVQALLLTFLPSLLPLGSDRVVF